MDSAVLLNLAMKFPTYFHKLYLINIQMLKYFGTLSPTTKARLAQIYGIFYSMLLGVWMWAVSVYPAVMSYGTKDIQEWRQPSNYILKPLSRLVLFMLPVQEQWVDSGDKGLEVYVGNQQVYGCGTLSLLVAVYLKKGVWLRTVTDSTHFQIPFWKHLIEFLGAVDKSKVGVWDQLTAGGYSVLFFPGGSKEFLKSASQDPYKLDFKESHLLSVLSASRAGYKMIPFGSSGASNMLQPLIDVPLPPSFVRTIPVVIPVSWQRQFLVFGEECYAFGHAKAEEHEDYMDDSTLKDGADTSFGSSSPSKSSVSSSAKHACSATKTYPHTLPAYLPLIQDCTAVMNKSLELQLESGDKRFLLLWAHKVALVLSRTFLSPTGIIMKVSNSLVVKVSNLARGAINNLLKKLKETPGPTLSEIG